MEIKAQDIKKLIKEVLKEEPQLIISAVKSYLETYEEKFYQLLPQLATKEDIKLLKEDIKLLKEDIKLLIDFMNRRFEDMNKRFEETKEAMKESIKMVIEFMNRRFEDVNKRFDDINKRLSFIEKIIILLLGCNLLNTGTLVAIVIKLFF